MHIMAKIKRKGSLGTDTSLKETYHDHKAAVQINMKSMPIFMTVLYLNSRSGPNIRCTEDNCGNTVSSISLKN